MDRKIFIGLAFLVLSFAVVGVGSADPVAKVRFDVHDDTVRSKLPRQAEIWIRGFGSWWIQPECKFGGTMKDINVSSLDAKQDVVIYPDGRTGGKKIAFSYKITSEMCLNACTRDAISISIDDSTVKVFGAPIKAVVGEFELKFSRKNK